MENFIEVISGSVVALLTWFTNRLVKNIDEKIAKQEKRLTELKTDLKDDLRDHKEIVNLFRAEQEQHQKRLIETSIAHAKLVEQKIDSFKANRQYVETNFDKLHGRILVIEKDSTLNKNSIKILEKKA